MIILILQCKFCPLTEVLLFIDFVASVCTSAENNKIIHILYQERFKSHLNFQTISKHKPNIFLEEEIDYNSACSQFYF